MQENHITELVGIEGYRVVDTQFEDNDEPPTARLRLERTEPDSGAICGCCGQVVETGYDEERFPVLDLPYGRWKRTILDVPRRRVECPDCGIRREQLPFVEWRRNYTQRLKEEVARTCRGLVSLTEVAGLYPLSWHQVKAIDEWWVQTQRPEVNWSDIRCIGVDEFSLKKGHHYATRVMDLTDPQRARTIWVGQHRRTESLEAFYSHMVMMGAEPDQLEAVCLDDWSPYREATRNWAPQAEIVQDPFHLIRRMNRVMGKVRNRLRKSANEQTARKLKGTKRLLEKSEEEVNEESQERLEALFEEVPRLGVVHRLKEDLRRLWEQPDRDSGRRWLNSWLQRARESNIPELVKFANKLADKREELVAGCEYGLNTSVIEGFNNRTKTLQKVAFGFHDRQYYFLKIQSVHSGGCRGHPH